MTQALVLGGGGPVGIAWEIGLAAGLAEEGVDIARADRIVGTSAGAVVGAQLRRGVHALYKAARDHVEDVALNGAPSSAALGPLIGFMMRRPPTGYPGPDLLAEIGAFARQAQTIDEASFTHRIGQILSAATSWPEGFLCTAVDAETGAFQVWDEAGPADLVRAVASSCAVPGLYPPVTIAGRRYVDGGVRSPTNLDLAEGFDHVLAVAVTVPMAADHMAGMARQELAPLQVKGSQTTLIVPDGASLVAFGPDLMDSSRRLVVLEAGLRQGRAEAGRLRAAWG